MARLDREPLIQRLPEDDGARLARLLRRGHGPQTADDARLLIEVAQDSMRGTRQARIVLVTVALVVAFGIAGLGLAGAVQVPRWAYVWAAITVVVAVLLPTILMRRFRASMDQSRRVLEQAGDDR